MKLQNFFPVLLALISLVFISASCDDDDDYINVSSNEVSLTNDQNSSTNFTVSSNVQWVVSVNYEGTQQGWLNVSTTNGNKGDNHYVTVTATSANYDKNDRVAYIVILGGDASANIKVVQKGNSAPVTNLSVSSTQLSLTKEQNSSETLYITSNEQWTASINYEGSQTGWLNVSTTKGNKCENNPITITTTSENHDNSARVARIIFKAGVETETVTVSQQGKNYDTNLDISITDVVALTTSVAYKHKFGKKVSYYYSGYLNSAAAGWTDEKIAKELESNFEAGKPDDDIISCDGLRANTSYILCAVGFDELGNQGRVMKEPVKTAAVVSKRPDVSIENVHLESDNGNIYWAWETVVGAYCAKYYMIAHSGDNAYVLGNSCDALVAWLIKDAINSGDIDPILKNSPWYMKRGNNENYFYCAAWAVGDDNKFSGELDTAFGHLSSNSKTRAVITNSTTKKYSAKHEELKKSIKVYSSTLY